MSTVLVLLAHGFEEIDALTPCDLVFLPCGAGVKSLRTDAGVMESVRHQHAAGRGLAAICAAPTVLHDAGLLTGRGYTAHFSVANELTAILAHERIVSDGKITT